MQSWSSPRFAKDVGTKTPPGITPRRALRRSRRQLAIVLLASFGAALLGARPALAIITSSGSVNVNQLLGAERFYDAGYTGTRAIQANIEAGHIATTHQTLGHVTTRVTGSGALGSDDSHATRVGAAMGGRRTPESGIVYPNDLRAWGIGYGADTWSGAIATFFGGSGTFSATNSSVASTYSAILQTGTQTGGLTADVFNSSWGFEGATGSNSWARGIDGLINNNGTIGVIAAGNSGPSANTVDGIGAGYNSITVGALSANSFVGVANFSSRGPNDFALATGPTTYTVIPGARAVVDLVAPGTNLTLATTGGATSYAMQRAGTSFAAPLVAGGASLIVDAGKDLYAGNSFATDGRVVKAVLLNSAEKIIGWSNGQSNVGGVIRTTQSLDWSRGAGRMNLDRAFDQYVTSAAGGMAGTTDLLGLGGGDIAPVGWDYGFVSSLATNTYFIEQPLIAGTNFTTTLTWFADRNPGTLTAFSGSQEQHLANLDLSVFLFDDLVNRNIIGTVAESVSLYNVVEHLSFLTPSTGYYGIQVTHSGAHWNFTSQPGEFYGLAWTSTPTAFASGNRFWVNAAGGQFNTAGNWNPAAVPLAADIAVFELNSDYTVSFSADVTTQRLIVGNDSVTFALAGHAYNLTSASPSDPSIIVGADPGDNARLELLGGTLSGQVALLGDDVASAGQVVVGAGATWTNAAELYVGRFGSGTLIVESGGSVVGPNAFLGAFLAATGTATVTGAGSQWHVFESLTVGGSLSGAGGSGSLDISDGGTVIVGDTLTIHQLGAVNLSGGLLDSATLDMAAGSFDMSGGRLVANAIIGDLTIVGGTLAPGASTGATTISGSFSPQLDATLEIELGGTLQGTAFDFLDVGGLAWLGGTLEVLLVNGFVPSFGDEFEILNAEGGINGTFADHVLPALLDNLSWSVNYGLNSVMLAVVLPGDFNGDGMVDAADYVFWRKHVGSQDQFDLWRANFGLTAPADSAAASGLVQPAAAVPEPSAYWLVILATIAALAASARPLRPAAA